MKQILKYLIFLIIGIIIFVLVNRKDGFSVGIPFNIGDRVVINTEKFVELEGSRTLPNMDYK